MIGNLRIVRFRCRRPKEGASTNRRIEPLCLQVSIEGHGNEVYNLGPCKIYVLALSVPMHTEKVHPGACANTQRDVSASFPIADESHKWFKI